MFRSRLCRPAAGPFLVLLVFVCCLSSSGAWGQTTDANQQGRAALEILDGWHAKNPKPGERALHLVCWTPSDRDFPKDYRSRLTRIMTHIQEFYLREMERHGFGSRSFNLIQGKDDQLLLHTVTSENALAMVIAHEIAHVQLRHPIEAAGRVEADDGHRRERPG